MRETLPQLTHKERVELRKLIKQCDKNPHGTVKFTPYLFNPTTGNYYWDRFIALGLVKRSSRNDKTNKAALFISPDGHHYFERYHDEQIRWFLKSAIIPLGVSILANTPNWWPMIQGLLKWIH